MPTVFQPARGLEAAIKGRPALDGYVYFTTDTKKIYMGQNGQHVPMGGNSGIYYANKTLTEDEAEADSVNFSQLDIDSEMTPQEDDLILNESDAFYRVSSVYVDNGETRIVGQKMIMAGGGSGGGGGGSSTSSRPVIKDSENTYVKYFTHDAREMLITLTATSTVPDNHIAEVSIQIGNKLFVDNGNNGRGYNFNEPILIDLKKYINDLSTSGSNTVQIRITDDYGNQSLAKNYTVYIVEILLESNSKNINSIKKGQNFTFYYTPKGGGSLTNRKIEIYIKSTTDSSEETKFVTYENPMNNNEVPQVLDMTHCNHGVYEITATYVGQIPNTDKFVSSNQISTLVICQDEEQEAPLVAAYLNGTEFQQYTSVNVEYMIIDKAIVTETSKVVLKVDESEVEVDAFVNGDKLNTWRQPFNATGNYALSIVYRGISTAVGNIIIIPYEGDVPVIDLTDANLIMSLRSQDHLSNSASNKEEWGWKEHNGKFENFLWGSANGWIPDKDDIIALKLTNGAKFTLPTFRPFQDDATVSGMTIDLDFSISGTTDYSKPVIYCLSQATNYTEKTFSSADEYKPNVYFTKTESGNYIPAVGDYVETTTYYERTVTPSTGFEITGQKMMLNSSLHKASITVIDGAETEDGTVSAMDAAVQGFTQFFNEGERIHLTYVIQRIATQNSNDYYFVYTYVNGVLSGIMRMDANEQFKESGTQAIFTCDSTYADINLYNFRVYTAAYATRTVINNYISDISDIDERIEKNKDNNIYTNDGSISLSAIQDLSYQLKVPYVLFNGGSAMNKKKTDSIKYTTTSGINFDLPYTKSDYRLTSMKMYDAFNPERNIDIPISLENDVTKEVIDKFEDIQIGTSYKPKRGVQLYGQGTSSMVYPVKNLRLRFIDKNDYPTVYDGSYPCEIICFKADYMDSSSSHNTGTANLVYDLLTTMKLQTPPQKFLSENRDALPPEQRYDISTAIRGYPIICFYAPSDSEEYTYIGRYNFNIDKATPEPFGFPGMKVYTGEKVTDNEGRERKVVKVCGLKTETVNGKLVLPLKQAEDGSWEEDEIELTQCWEMKNNDVQSPTKFLKLDGYSTFEESLTSGNNWLDFYEDRYPDEIVGDAEDGKDTSEATKNFFDLCKWLNSFQIFDGDGNYIDIPNENPKIVEGVSRGQDNGILPDDLTTLDFTEQDIIKDGKVVGTIIPGDSQIRESLESANAYSEENFNYIKNHLAELTTALTPLREKKNQFRAEFETHLDKDFTLFYYCLTMTLLMMDNRAKNMMIASWDQQKWYPIFYDMDSMLGLNNTGVNKYTFSVEDGIAERVFNGYDSVLWNNVRECYYNDICKFYARMRDPNTGGLTLTNLLRIYNVNSADKWNEALCTADAEYKYIRPYKEGYLDGKNLDEDGNPVRVEPGKINYLYAGQGRRSNHRAWWLKNRLSYLDSKYLPSTYKGSISSVSNSMKFRAYNIPKQGESGDKSNACLAQTPANHKFSLTALNDSYQSLLIGSNIYGPVYTPAGKTAVIGSDRANSEVESWILNTDLIADLGDLSDKYLGMPFEFPTTKMKITELKLGRSSRSHPGYYDKYYNENLTGLNIGSSCPYLQHLNIARCKSLTTVDLSACTRLMTVDAEQCENLTSITFPEDSILQKLYLPGKLSILTLKNQPNLEVVEFDSTASLNTLNLEGVPKLNSYPLAKAVFVDGFNPNDSGQSTKYFRMLDINWTINENSLNNGKLEKIDILDNLLNTKISAVNNAEKKTALSGIITIDIEGAIVDEYKIYEKYNKAFPNLTIQYSDKVTLTRAISIKFMRLEEGAENNTVFYQTFAPTGNTENTLQFLTSADGPNGSALGIPAKDATVENTYTFKEWANVDMSIKPTVDMVIYPIYTPVPRYYQINFFNYDNTVVWGESLPYGAKYTINNYAYRDSGTLPENERYEFIGWTTTNYNGTSVTNPTLLDVSGELTVTGAFNAYAFYERKNCYTTVSKLEYFDFNENYTVQVPVASGGTTPVNGVRISLKPQYRYDLRGKITLPLTYNNKPIVSIGNFAPGQIGQNTQFTHVFFLNDGQTASSYVEVSDNAFSAGADKYEDAGTSALKSIYLPDTIRKIGSVAFKNCRELENITLNDNIISIGNGAFQSGDQGPDFMKVHINELPANLRTLNVNAFESAGRNVIVTKLPATLQTLDAWSLSHCPNVNVSEFGSWDGSSVLAFIGDSALYESGSTITEIFVGSSVTNISANAFRQYAVGTLQNAYLAYSEGSPQYNSQDASGLGLPPTRVNVSFNFTPEP